jgi:hypothetical protein
MASLILVDESHEQDDNSLEELQREYETIVASLTACIKGLKTLRKTATAATTATATKEVRIRKGGVTKSLNRVLDKAEGEAGLAGTSYGTAVLEALEGADIVDVD